MKREVWVECGIHEDGSFLIPRRVGVQYIKKITLHESRWIPVSERMPDKPEHYLVVRLDRLDWCYCELCKNTSPWPGNTIEENNKLIPKFTSKGVTHWLEAPPLPVETEPSDFERWYAHNGEWYEKKLLAEKAWNAAKELNK